MARVTVEDCVTKVPNRFDLVMRAAHRTRSISAGAALTVERDNDKNPVLALREIAEESIDIEELRSALIKDQQKHVEMDEPEEDEMDLIAMQQEMNGEMGATTPDSEDVPQVEDKGAEGKAEPEEAEGENAAQDKDGGS